jgi:hypothetical protein
MALLKLALTRICNAKHYTKRNEMQMQTYLLDELFRDLVAQLGWHVHLGQLVDQRLDGTLTLAGTCALKMNFKNVSSAPCFIQLNRDAPRHGVTYIAHDRKAFVWFAPCFSLLIPECVTFNFVFLNLRCKL